MRYSHILFVIFTDLPAAKDCLQDHQIGFFLPFILYIQLLLLSKLNKIH